MFERWLDGRIAELGSLYATLTPAERDVHGLWFRSRVRRFTETSEFLARTNARPRGYAGDSEMMRMLYDDELRGTTVLGCLLHRHPIRSDAAQAVRNRIRFLADLLRRDRGCPNDLRVLSLACGPARELRHLIASETDAEGLELVLADQDEEALAEARDEIHRVESAIGAPIRAETTKITVRDVLRNTAPVRSLEPFDVIYTLGLFDYLERSVAKELVERLVELVRPGGRVVVGNFHTRCATRAYLDVWMDWPLLYRTEDELLELSDDLPVATRSIETEPTRSQIFLVIEK